MKVHLLYGPTKALAKMAVDGNGRACIAYPTEECGIARMVAIIEECGRLNAVDAFPARDESTDVTPVMGVDVIPMLNGESFVWAKYLSFFTEENEIVLRYLEEPASEGCVELAKQRMHLGQPGFREGGVFAFVKANGFNIDDVLPLGDNSYEIFGSFTEAHPALGSWMGHHAVFKKLCSVRFQNDVLGDFKRIDSRGRFGFRLFHVFPSEKGQLHVAEWRERFPERNEASICVLSQIDDGSWGAPEVVTAMPSSEIFRGARSGLPRIRGYSSGRGMGVFFHLRDGLVQLSEKAEGAWTEPQPVWIHADYDNESWDVAAEENGVLNFVYSRLGERILLKRRIDGEWQEPVVVVESDGEPLTVVRLAVGPPEKLHLLFLRKTGDNSGVHEYCRLDLAHIEALSTGVQDGSSSRGPQGKKETN